MAQASGSFERVPAGLPFPNPRSGWKHKAWGWSEATAQRNPGLATEKVVSARSVRHPNRYNSLIMNCGRHFAGSGFLSQPSWGFASVHPRLYATARLRGLNAKTFSPTYSELVPLGDLRTRNHRLKSVPLNPELEGPPAAATEFCSGRIGRVASRAKNFHRSRRIPGNGAAAQRCAATATEFCAGGLFHVTAGAANSGCTDTKLVQAGQARRSGGHRTTGMDWTFASNWPKAGIPTTATELRASGKARPALCARDHNVGRQSHPGDAAETATL